MSVVAEPKAKKGKKRKGDELPSMRVSVADKLPFTPIELVRVDQFERHPQNRIPRPEDIDARAKSIRDKGQISPITARRREGHERYQILCGETRWRAHQQLGLVLIQARIIECSDAEAIVYMGTDNTERKDLTASERARHARNLLDVGYSREQVAAELKLSSPSSVSNLVKLLEAPECWLRALDEGVVFARDSERKTIYEGTVREIAKFSEAPELAAKILDSFGNAHWFPESRHQQINQIYNSVKTVTRSMSDRVWYGERDGVIVEDLHKPRFKIDADVRSRLRCVTVPNCDGKLEERALNVEEFDRLQWEALAKLVARKSKADGKTGKATAASKKKQQDEQLAKWCLEWKYWLLRCELASRIDFPTAGWVFPWLLINAVRDHRCNGEDLVIYAVDNYWTEPKDRKLEPLLSTLLRVEKDAQASGPTLANGHRRDMFLRIGRLVLWPTDHLTRDPSLVAELVPERLPFLPTKELDALAKSMEVTLEEAWQSGTLDGSSARALVAQFLRRHTCQQLEELADELGVRLHASGKAAMVSELLGLHKAGSPLPVPAVLTDKKSRTKGGA